MAPLKKRGIIDNVLSHSSIPSSAQPILVQASASVAPSSIAAAIAAAISAAIEATGKKPTSISLRFDTSPESPSFNSNSTARFHCPSRRINDIYDDEITIISNDSQKEMDEMAITDPRCSALPSTHSPWSDHYHCENSPEMLSGVSSQDAVSWALFEDAARSAMRPHHEIPSVDSSDKDKNIRESDGGDLHHVARHWQRQSVMSHTNGRVAHSSTFCLPCLHEARPSIVATINDDSKEAYEGDRHLVSRPDTLVSLLPKWDKAMACAGVPKGWAYSPANDIRTKNTAWDPWYMASRQSTWLDTRTVYGGADMYADRDTGSVMDKGIRWDDERQGETRGEELAPGMVQKRKRKKCNHERCTKYAQTGGVCCRHGAKRSKSRKYCSHETCTKFVQRSGFCFRHGAGM